MTNKKCLVLEKIKRGLFHSIWTMSRTNVHVRVDVALATHSHFCIYVFFKFLTIELSFPSQISILLRGRMTKRPPTNSKKPPKPTKSCPTKNSVSSTTPTDTPASIPTPNSPPIPSRGSAEPEASAVSPEGATVPFTFISRAERRRSIRRNCSKPSSVPAAVGAGGIAVLGRDPICKCMFG